MIDDLPRWEQRLKRCASARTHDELVRLVVIMARQAVHLDAALSLMESRVPKDLPKGSPMRSAKALAFAIAMLPSADEVNGRRLFPEDVSP
jgi:hypothetical protein